MKKFCVFAGNYGSGKTELSLNFAINAAKEGKRTVLLDMDIVNPYFRSSEHEAMLTELGIRVIKPTFANTMVDVPSLPAEVYVPFDADIDLAVFDAGGDPVGAAALGILSEKFAENAEDTEFYYVINARRPLQEDSASVEEMLRQIEGRAKLKVTQLINNTNLAYETTEEDVEYGLKVVGEVSSHTGIPVAFTSVGKWLKEKYPDAFEVNIHTRPEWLD